MQKIESKNKSKNLLLKIFAILVLLLFIGVVVIIALGNIDKIAILWRTP